MGYGLISLSQDVSALRADTVKTNQLVQATNLAVKGVSTQVNAITGSPIQNQPSSYECQGNAAPDSMGAQPSDNLTMNCVAQ